MRFSIILLLLGFTLSTLSAQNMSGLAEQLGSLDGVDRIVMPKVDNKEELDAELNRRSPGTAPRFAVNLDVNISPKSQGTWEITADDVAVWRLRIYSRKAKSLNLGFTKYFMPPGGKLFLYSPDYERVMGPFTPSDNEEHEQLWTPILEGDELVIEVQVPMDEMDNLELELKYVNHDFIGFSDMSSLLSGGCNLDVICGEADGWEIVEDYRDIIQSVAVISTGGNTFCTGFLVNNARQDCTPYFMTAFHCGVTTGNDQSLVAYWNYQNSVCRQPNSPQSGAPGDGVLNDFNTGSTLRATWQTSDFTLVEFDDPISETAEAFFAGWNAEDEEPTSSIAVHHPSTDEKRISFENEPGTFTTYLNDNPSTNFTHVRVDDWDIGTTEPGSSGSPLFDQDKRVIGQLHGGFAACGNNDPDWYGSMHVSWEGGGTPTTRLKDWLDPDNLGILVLDGRSQESCGFFVEAVPAIKEACNTLGSYTIELSVSENFAGAVSLSIDDAPAGVNTSFSTNPVMPGGTATLTVENIDALNNGSYNMTLSATDGVDQSDTDLSLIIYNGTPGLSNAVFPANGETGVNTQIDLIWEEVDFTQMYSWEVASDMAFTDVIASGTGNSSTALVADLMTETTYYWHVRADNLCGEGNWSATFQFETANISCNAEVSDDVPVAISAYGTPTVSSSFYYPIPGEILDINVLNLVGNHTYISDLIFELTSPDGTTITLIDTYCGSENDFNISFDDDAPGNSIPCPYNDGGTYQPQENLSAFNGEDAQGVWTLTIQDVFNQDGGALENWELEICTALSAFVTSSPGLLTGCAGDSFQYTVDVSAGFTGPVTLDVDGVPAGALVTITPNPVSPGESATIEIATSGSDAGSYALTFLASDGTNNESSSGNLDVEDGPGEAVLSNPADGADLIPVETDFIWEVVPDATNYIFELSDVSDFSTLVESETTGANNFIPGTPLEYDKTYFWRVTSINDCGTLTSEVSTFSTEFFENTTEVGGLYYHLLPNPTTDEILLEFSIPLQQDLIVDIFTVDGRQLQSRMVNPGEQFVSFSLGAYPDGVYLMRLQSGTASIIERVLVVD
ncbi:MAG: T9SS type A sorting domain-containing protein [Bacteroidetes bacterium]|nr:T9SS type A sorting domain-containing protein [Bacteroidota bacterium]